MSRTGSEEDRTRGSTIDKDDPFVGGHGGKGQTLRVVDMTVRDQVTQKGPVSPERNTVESI